MILHEYLHSLVATKESDEYKSDMMINKCEITVTLFIIDIFLCKVTL